MAKKKNPSQKSSSPSSLYHHTTAEVLLCLFSPIIEKSETELLTFRASESNCMNDTLENKIITNNLGLESDNLIKKFLEVREELNKVYVISFTGGRDSIPMWGMYGGNSDGIALRFGLKKLKKYFPLVKTGEVDNLNFNPTTQYLIQCKYGVQSDLQTTSKKNRDFFKKHQSDATAIVNAFNRWQLEAISFKHKSFKYENEYRIVAFSKTSLFQNGQYGLKEYYDIKIPLSLLEEILISPLCKTDTKRSIETLCRQIESITGKKIKITASKLSLR